MKEVEKRGNMAVEFTLEELEKKIGYEFANKSLLKQALTHSSYANEQKINKLKDYERLEFLGDAVLELVSSEFLFHENPQMPEGKLTKLRSSMVCEPSLAYCAKDLELGEYMLLGKGRKAPAEDTGIPLHRMPWRQSSERCIWMAALWQPMISSISLSFPIWRIRFFSTTARRCCRR